LFLLACAELALFVLPVPGPKYVVTIVLSDRDCPIKVFKFWRIDDVLVDFWEYFYGASAETVISELPAAALTTSLDSANPISFKTGMNISASGIHFQFFFVFCSQKSPIFLLPAYST